MLTRRGFVRTGLALFVAPTVLALGSACAVLPGAQSPSAPPAGPDNGAQSGTLQVAWWGGNDRAERTQKVMDQFSARFTQWKFNSSFTNFFAYWDKINTQAAGGGLPDVFQMDMRYIGQFVSKKLVLDMSRFTDTALNLKDFDEGLLSQGKLEGGLYGIPLGGIVQATVYDKTAIQEAGMTLPTGTETWADYAAYCQKLSKALPRGVYASDDESINIDPFEVFIRQRSKELYTAVPNPAGPSGTRPGAYLKAGSLFSISAKTGFAQGAASFVGFFNTDPEAVKVLGLERGVPGSAKARETLKPVLNPNDAVQLEYFNQQTKNTTAKTVLDPPGAGEFQKALARNALSIPLSGVSVGEAADKLLAEATKALSA